MNKVIISNGFGKFHLAVAAAEAHRRGLLSLFLTGAYPTAGVKRLAAGLGLARGRKVGRLLARGEDVPAQLVRTMWLPEAVQQTAYAIRRRPFLAGASAWLNELSLRLYGGQAVKYVEEVGAGAKLYHYRAGFGHESVRAAKKLGMVTLCDHSIAHPAVLYYLIDNHGRLPPPGVRGPMSRVWKDILDDIGQADAVLVNSDFVKDTFRHQGWDDARVHVIYWGIDEQFLSAAPPPDRRGESDESSPTRLLFAGLFDRRKGAVELLTAVESLRDLPWRLEIVGGIAPDVERDFGNVLADPRVAIQGYVPRAELATRMAAADVFVFPSLAEGSARVVFEALACGCYVITTANAGSIVEDGVHGALVPPGDADALAAAIRQVIADRAMLLNVGRRNAELVRRQYRQSHYGAALERLYRKLRRPPSCEPRATAL